jgi:hypothetical protein
LQVATDQEANLIRDEEISRALANGNNSLIPIRLESIFITPITGADSFMDSSQIWREINQTTTSWC